MGGEHFPASIGHITSDGSSPRGRGTRFCPLFMNGSSRIIPAWAGNTGSEHCLTATLTDHPRVGGEHLWARSQSNTTSGSSPRGRGTPLGTLAVKYDLRIIPAWAGNTLPVRLVLVVIADHPRVGGEHLSDCTKSGNSIGSSPRGRGTLPGGHGLYVKRRIIPAWAGNTRHERLDQFLPADHPRVGGEHNRDRLHVLADYGSSPRGRGTRFCPLFMNGSRRIIPAWAGNTNAPFALSQWMPDHPRVGGEHSRSAIMRSVIAGSSPRGRGTRKHG